MIKQKDKSQIGLSGEFFVMGELLRRGFQASFTFGNMKAIDIYASKGGSKSVMIQVKTNANKPRKDFHAKWQIGNLFFSKKEITANLFIVFVLINDKLNLPLYKIARYEDVKSFAKKHLEDIFKDEDMGKRKYRGKLTREQRMEYPMKDFPSWLFEPKGYAFLEWEEMFCD